MNMITRHCSLSAEQSEINRIIAEASKGSKFYEVHLQGPYQRSLNSLPAFQHLE